MLYGSFVVIALAFIIGGIIMLIVERFRPVPDVLDVDSLPVGRALAIGSFQALALIPGVSRSGGTIVAAMAMRVDRAAAAEFTFFLAMPTMAAAFAHDLLEARHDLGSARGAEIAVGFVMAFLASALVVKPFLQLRPSIRLRAVCLVSHRARAGPARGGRRRLDVGTRHAVAPPELRRRVLRHGAAVHQRRRVHLDLQRRRRSDDAAVRPRCSDGGSPDWARRRRRPAIVLVGTVARNVFGRQSPLARRGLAAEGAGASGRSTRRSSS